MRCYLGKPAGKENILDIAGCNFKRWRTLLSIKLEKCRGKHYYSKECSECSFQQESYVPYGIFNFNDDSMIAITKNNLENFIYHYSSFLPKPTVTIGDNIVGLQKMKVDKIFFPCNHSSHSKKAFDKLSALRQHEIDEGHISDLSRTQTFNSTSDSVRWDKIVNKQGLMCVNENKLMFI
jgi:hypothetical protein